MKNPRRVLLACLVADYCFVMGATVGTLVERIRFDPQRTAVLARYDSLSTRMHDRLMAIEKSAPRHATADRSLRAASLRASAPRRGRRLAD